jgi:hypothetical protein
MNYNAKDIEQFINQKQFIDTAIVPLLPVDFSTESGMRSGSEADFLMSLVTYVEKQFKGRIFLTPPFSYFQKTVKIDINDIHDNLIQSGFKHVLFITCDARWKQPDHEKSVMWLPAIPLESMELDVKNRILQDQLNYVLPKLTQVWTSN